MGIFLVVQFNLQIYVFIAYNKIFINIIQEVDDYQAFIIFFVNSTKYNVIIMSMMMKKIVNII